MSTGLLALLAMAAAPSAQQSKPPVFRLNTQIVSVDVIVRDSSGAVVHGLKADDFQVFEDGKPQEIRSFAFEEISSQPRTVETVDVLADAAAKLKAEAARKPPAVQRTAAPAAAAPEAAPKPMSSEDLAGRRLIILLFDVSSMQPEDVQRAVDSATRYVNDKMSPADMVAVATVSTRLDVVTDFTSDRMKVGGALNAIGYKEGTATAPPAADTAATDEAQANDETTEDASDMDMFNNDVRLRALKALAETLAPIEQKKSILYFSAGMERSGEDNQVELRAAINAAVRAHVAIYPVDTRGLQAVVPGGDATRASGRGTALFSGRGVVQQFSSMAASQDTLGSLAADTGGRAFMDSNDFGEAFTRVERDMSAYYLIGYATANNAKDGRFRRIQVKVKKPGLKVEARQGYYADRDFAHTARTDRETQLQEQLFSAMSPTDLPILVNATYFRLASDRYYVPIAMAVPGSAIPVPAEKDKDRIELDVLGVVQDEQGRPVGRIRQTMKLPPRSVGTLTAHQILYQSGLTLPPGRFSVKVVVRENTSGLMGSFEAAIVVPELKQAPLKLSSVILSTQLQPVAGKSDSPLVRNGEQLVPNLTHIVGKDQKMFFYYEVYDPAAAENTADVRTSLAFYRGKVKVFETPPVERTRMDDASRKAAVFQLEVPAGSLPPGFYTCQINVIDEIAGKFAFPRLMFLIR